MCPKACCGKPVTECKCGPDCEHCDCYAKNKAMKESVNEAITITADSPEDLPALQRIMQLAGMKPVSQDMMPQDDAPDMTMKGDDNINGNCGCGDTEEAEYENQPNEQYSDVEDITRLAGLNGLNGSKHPQDLRVKDPAQQEGYANSMGNEKEGEKYSDEELEDEYGKTELKKLPRKFSKQGDNPLEDIEEALRSDYISFINESLTLSTADQKKNLIESGYDKQYLETLTEEEILTEWIWFVLGALLFVGGVYLTVDQAINMYEQAGNDFSIFVDAIPFGLSGTRESSAQCGAFYKQNKYFKPGWCQFTQDNGDGPDPAMESELNSFYFFVGLTFVGGGGIKIGSKLALSAKAKKAKEMQDLGKGIVDELVNSKKLAQATQATEKTSAEILAEVKKLTAKAAEAHKAVKGSELMVDLNNVGQVVVKNLKTGESLFLDPKNREVINLLKNVGKEVDDVSAVWKALQTAAKGPGASRGVSPSGITLVP